jgi:hypothetical protein
VASWFTRRCEASSEDDACAPPHHEERQQRVTFSARRANHFDFPESCQALRRKIFCFTEPAIRSITHPVPRPRRDVSRSSRYVGRGMRWTLRRQAGSSRRTKTPQRTAKSCGPGAATVASSRRAYPAGDGGKKRRSPGRARISRKTIARGKPGCLGCTCSLTRVLFCATRRTRDCGCIQRPAFPAPSRRREG